MPAQSQRKIDGGRIAGIAEVTNCVEIRWIFKLANQKFASVRCFGSHEGSFISSAAMANQLYTPLANAWKTRLNQFLNSGVSFEYLTIREMTKATNPEYVSTLAATPSTGLGTPMPQDVALCLTAHTNERGRGAKGRMYFCGWTTGADGGSGQATTACRDALTALGGDIATQLNAVALTPAVAKPRRQEYTGLTGALHAERPAHAAQVLAYSCIDTEWDTQRRRGF